MVAVKKMGIYGVVTITLCCSGICTTVKTCSFCSENISSEGITYLKTTTRPLVFCLVTGESLELSKEVS